MLSAAIVPPYYQSGSRPSSPPLVGWRCRFGYVKRFGSIHRGERLRLLRVDRLAPAYAPWASASRLSCAGQLEGVLSDHRPGGVFLEARRRLLDFRHHSALKFQRMLDDSPKGDVVPRGEGDRKSARIGDAAGLANRLVEPLGQRLLLAGDLLENRPELLRPPVTGAANLDRIRGERTRGKVEQAVPGGNRVGSDHLQELDLSGKKHRCGVLCLGKQRAPEHAQENQQEGDQLAQKNPGLDQRRICGAGRPARCGSRTIVFTTRR